MSDETRRWLVGTIKAAKWEEAKGALRAVVAIEGSHPSGYSKVSGAPNKLEELHQAVEGFINAIEEQGLQE